MFFLSFILFSCLTLVTHLGGKNSANLTLAVKKPYFDTYLLLSAMLVTKVQVTDLGGKSSANLTYFGREKTLL